LLFLSKDLDFIAGEKYLDFEQILRNISVKLNNLIQALKKH
jgi:hypothetical protein